MLKQLTFDRVVIAALTLVVLIETRIVSAGTNSPTTIPAFAGTLTSQSSPPTESLSLWFRQPATDWTSALPVGNGKQGGMMFGGIDSEVICLNEDTLWAGGPYTPDNPNAYSALADVRQLIWDGKYSDAQRLISQKMMAKPLGQLPYQPVGDLQLEFPAVATAENYRRELNLRTATTSVEFASDGVTFSRELFASYPDNVLVLHLTASKPGQINCKLSLRTNQNLAESNDPGSDDSLIISGTNRAAQGIAGALKFQCKVRVLHDGGTIRRQTTQIGGSLQIAGQLSLTGEIAPRS